MGGAERLYKKKIERRRVEEKTEGYGGKASFYGGK